MQRNAAAIVKEKERCKSLARKLYSNSNISTWQSCIGVIDQSTITKALQKKNQQRYVQYINKKAKNCTGSYAALLSAHNDCKYTSGTHSGTALSNFLQYQKEEITPDWESACFANAPCSYTYGFIDLEAFVIDYVLRTVDKNQQQ